MNFFNFKLKKSVSGCTPSQKSMCNYFTFSRRILGIREVLMCINMTHAFTNIIWLFCCMLAKILWRKKRAIRIISKKSREKTLCNLRLHIQNIKIIEKGLKICIYMYVRKNRIYLKFISAFPIQFINLMMMCLLCRKEIWIERKKDVCTVCVYLLIYDLWISAKSSIFNSTSSMPIHWRHPHATYIGR